MCFTVRLRDKQVFEQALQSWEVNLAELEIMLVLSSGEIVKEALESSVRAAAISELMVQKELQLGTLRAVKVWDRVRLKPLEMTRPFLKLQHNQRFQTRISKVFGEILRQS